MNTNAVSNRPWNAKWEDYGWTLEDFAQSHNIDLDELRQVVKPHRPITMTRGGIQYYQYTYLSKHLRQIMGR